MEVPEYKYRYTWHTHIWLDKCGTFWAVFYLLSCFLFTTSKAYHVNWNYHENIRPQFLFFSFLFLISCIRVFECSALLREVLWAFKKCNAMNKIINKMQCFYPAYPFLFVVCLFNQIYFRFRRLDNSVTHNCISLNHVSYSVILKCWFIFSLHN